MTSIRITSFGGLLPEVTPRSLPPVRAQVAHNCLLWDGSLRPQAEWYHASLVATDQNAKSITYAAEINQVVAFSELYNAIYMNGAPLPTIALGMKNNKLHAIDGAVFGPVVDVTLTPPAVTGTITYQAAFNSKKPVHRLYGVSYIGALGGGTYESRLSAIPGQNLQAITYEGDIAILTIAALAPPPLAKFFRVYRTITGMDTGENVTNNLDTDWHLVYTGAVGMLTAGVVVRDGGTTIHRPLDVFLAKDFFTLDITPSHIEMLESGWVAVANSGHNLCVSERYNPIAYPTENKFYIPETIVDIAVHYDNVYIGTTGRAYAMAVAQGEQAPMQAGLTPFRESYACNAGTMAGTDFGAMYAGANGLIGLSKEGIRLLTGNLAAGGDPIYSTIVSDTATQEPLFEIDVTLQSTYFGAYAHGTYYGFGGVVKRVIATGLEVDDLFPGTWYLAEINSEISDPHPLQQLVTMDPPSGYVPIYSCRAPSGLYILMEARSQVVANLQKRVYTLPNPNTQLGLGIPSYINSPKQTYRWKSKKFVMPGTTVMSAAKVVHDCSGCVRLKIYVDCVCRYETVVCNCKPFRLPAHLIGVEWEIELVGTATVYEVHIAASMQELLEHG